MATTVETLSKTLRGKHSSLAFAWLADLQLEAGDQEGAEQTLDSGLMEHPDFVPGLMVKAKLLMQTERSNDAAPILVRVLEQDPMHLAAQRHLATVYIAQAKGKEAQALLLALKELDGSANNVPELPDALLNAIHQDTAAPKLSMPRSTNELFIEKDALFASLEDAFLDEEANAGDEKSAADLRLELDAALASTPHVETAPEFFPADDPAAQGGDVSSLMAQMFGAEEISSKPDGSAPVVQPPPLDEISSAPAAMSSLFTAQEAPSSESSSEPSSKLSQPASSGLFEKASESIFSKPAVEKSDAPSSSDSLFEKASSPTFIKSEPVVPREQPKFESSASTSTPGGVDLASALDDLFGEDNDELPVELATNTQVPEVSAELELVPPAPSADPELTQGVASALGGIFGEEDDLPQEKTSAQLDIVGEEDAPQEAVAAIEAPVADDPTGLRTGVASALGGMFGEEDDLPVEHTSFTNSESNPSTESSLDLDDAEEHSQESRGATTMDEILGGDPNAIDDSPIESSMLQLESISDSLYEKTAEPTPPTENEDFQSGVAGAFGSLFGEFDDAPVEGEKPAAEESFPYEAPKDSPFADLLSALDEPVHHEEGASLGGNFAASLIENPTEPIPETESLDTPALDASALSVPTPAADDSFSGGMSSALTNLFGAELDEDLSDLLDEKIDGKTDITPSATSTKTLAELYLSQGHLRDALQVFMELESREPGDSEVAKRIAEIHLRIDAGESEPTE